MLSLRPSCARCLICPLHVPANSRDPRSVESAANPNLAAGVQAPGFAAMLAVASLPAYTPRPNLNPYLSVPPRERAGAISPPDVNQTEHLKLARLEECDDVQPPHGC